MQSGRAKEGRAAITARPILFICTFSLLLPLALDSSLPAALPLGNAHRAGNVAGDVQAGAAHIEQAVHAVDDHNQVDVDAHSGQHHGQHNHARAGYAGGADGGQGGGDHDGDHLSDTQVHACAGGQEDGGHALVDGGAVHIDGGAQRQDEGGNIILRAQLIRALLGHRQGGRGGGGREGEHHGGERRLEELQRAHAGKDLGGHRVHQHRVDDIAQIGAQQHQRQGAQDLRALGGDHPRHHGEHADGREADDEAHQLLDHRIGGGDKVAAQPPLLLGSHDGPAQKEGDDDDLQHVGTVEGGPHVVGKDALQGVHEVGGGSLFPYGSVLQGQLREEAGGIENIGERQTDHTSDGGGHQEIGHGFPAHGANLLHVVHGQDAVDHTQQYHGHHDELQQVHKDIAEGL